MSERPGSVQRATGRGTTSPSLCTLFRGIITIGRYQEKRGKVQVGGNPNYPTTWNFHTFCNCQWKRMWMSKVTLTCIHQWFSKTSNHVFKDLKPCKHFSKWYYKGCYDKEWTGEKNFLIYQYLKSVSPEPYHHTPGVCWDQMAWAGDLKGPSHSFQWIPTLWCTLSLICEQSLTYVKRNDIK